MERALAQTPVTISGNGQTQDYEYTFTLDPSWKRADLGFTAWVQGPSSDAEVHNAVAKVFDRTGVAPASLGRVKATFQ